MLGKPEWFTYRSAGWGVSPRTWQGRAYTLGFVALMVGIGTLPLDPRTKGWLGGGLLALFILDILTIMVRLGDHHDERERYHQLVIERNCSMAAVTALTVALVVKTYQAAGQPGDHFLLDPWLLGILGVMGATKFLSTLYVRRRL